jgi:hypothetical protein
MAEKPETIRHAEAPALVAADSMGVVAAEAFTAAVAGVGNRRSAIFPARVKFRIGDKPYAANELDLQEISFRQSS